MCDNTSDYFPFFRTLVPRIYVDSFANDPFRIRADETFSRRKYIAPSRNVQIP